MKFAYVEQQNKVETKRLEIKRNDTQEKLKQV